MWRLLFGAFMVCLLFYAIFWLIAGHPPSMNCGPDVCLPH